jgi:hypothetical protein
VIASVCVAVVNKRQKLKVGINIKYACEFLKTVGRNKRWSAQLWRFLLCVPYGIPLRYTIGHTKKNLHSCVDHLLLRTTVFKNSHAYFILVPPFNFYLLLTTSTHTDVITVQ